MSSWNANKNIEPHLTNWVDKLNLHCIKPYNIGLFGMFACLGKSISCMLIPALVSRFGRKRFTYVSAAVQLICYFALVISSSTLIYLLVIFIFGVTLPLKHFVTYPHLMELMPRQQALVGGMMRCLDGLVFSVSPLILHFLTSDTRQLILIAIVLNLIVLITIMINYVPESIKFNLGKGRYQ